MHLMIPTHLSLFWVVCHPSRTFPSKEFKREPKIGFSLLPTSKPYIFLSLTHDPPLLYWLGTSWWCLSLVHAPLPYVSMACLLFMRLPWPKGLFAHFATHSWPLVAWISLWAFVLYVSLPSWAGSCLIVGSSFSNPFLTLFCGLVNTSAMPS